MTDPHSVHDFEVVPLDESSMEDYCLLNLNPDPYVGQSATAEALAAERQRRIDAKNQPIRIVDGVRDTRSL
jgi:hypothetical protein